jgi:hypothetical protein
LDEIEREELDARVGSAIDEGSGLYSFTLELNLSNSWTQS